MDPRHPGMGSALRAHRGMAGDDQAHTSLCQPLIELGRFGPVCLPLAGTGRKEASICCRHAFGGGRANEAIAKGDGVDSDWLKEQGQDRNLLL